MVAGSGPELIGLEGDPAAALVRCETVLLGGGTVVLPTDTVYGVAAAAVRPEAVARLAVLKERSAGQPLAVLVADESQVLDLAQPPDDRVRGWMEEHWPGPLTLVLRRREDRAGLALGGDPATVGVRCPAHRFVRDLARRVGPIATTSANRHGEPTPTTAAEAAASLTAPVDLVIDGGSVGTVASTVVDVTTPTPKVLRTGALPPEALGM